MNEITLVRELLPEPPPPSASARAAARSGLTDEIAGRRGHRHARKLQFGLSGLVAVGAAAAVTAALLAGGGEPPGPGVPGTSATAAPRGARQALLAAAETAERQPASDGKYWRTSMLWQEGEVRRAVDRYTAKDGTTHTYARSLLGTGRSGRSKGRSTGDGDFSLLGRPLTLAQIRALPTGQQDMEKWVSALVRRQNPGAGREQLAENAVVALTGLLGNLPAPPKARAAAFRVLAARPDVRDGGTVRDALKREGHELRARYQVVVVDPATSLLLAVSPPRQPAGKRAPSVNLYRQVGWTDDEPHYPDVP